MKAHPDWKICALGGSELQDAGAQLLFDLTEHSVVGLFEVLKNYGFFKSLFEATVQWIRQHQPRAVCYVDYPGFNLRLAKRLCQDGIAAKGGGAVRQLFYISPQIWAWKTGRRFKMADTLDALAVIFPFEVDCYKDTDLPVTFVGHPFAQSGYHPPLEYEAGGPVLLLPGSRQTPVKRILPLMLEGFREFLKSNPDTRAQILYPSETIRSINEGILKNFPDLIAHVEVVPQNETHKASAVLTSSGTMSLQVALAGIPGAIVYRANPFTYFIGRRVVKIPYLGIANIILNKAAWPEFLQGAASPKTLAEQLVACQSDRQRIDNTMGNRDLLFAALGKDADCTPTEWLIANCQTSP